MKKLKSYHQCFKWRWLNLTPLPSDYVLRKFRSRATTSLIYNRISYFWRIHFLHMTHTCIVSILKLKLIPCLHEHFSKIVSNQIIWLCLWLCHWCFELFVKHHPNFSSFPTFLKFQTISVHKFIFFQLEERSKILNSGSARSLKKHLTT